MSLFGLCFQKCLIFFGLIATCLADNPEERGEYIEGDILSVAPSLESAGLTRTGLVNTKYRWPDATIPFEFEPSYPDILKRQFYRATAHISERTCIKFKARTTERDYIRLIQSRGCSSHMGRIGGAQSVSLSRNCNILGVFVHELIHAIGFHHEQTRSDRDNYVTIHHDNIRPGTQHNFVNLHGNSMYSLFDVAYDYNSVMHYSSTAFSKNGKKTIEPKKAGVSIGQRTGMSQGDIQKVNNMYCNGSKTRSQGQRNLKL